MKILENLKATWFFSILVTFFIIAVISLFQIDVGFPFGYLSVSVFYITPYGLILLPATFLIAHVIVSLLRFLKNKYFSNSKKLFTAITIVFFVAVAAISSLFQAPLLLAYFIPVQGICSFTPHSDGLWDAKSPCLKTVAVVKRDEKICSSIKFTSVDCYEDLAVIKNDITICLLLRETSASNYIDHCRDNYHRLKKDNMTSKQDRQVDAEKMCTDLNGIWVTSNSTGPGAMYGVVGHCECEKNELFWGQNGCTVIVGPWKSHFLDIIKVDRACEPTHSCVTSEAILYDGTYIFTDSSSKIVEKDKLIELKEILILKRLLEQTYANQFVVKVSPDNCYDASRIEYSFSYSGNPLALDTCQYIIDFQSPLFRQVEKIRQQARAVIPGLSAD
ncbi:MAG: hypothetical protein WC575_02300 [Patescibacteria group bacterium]